MVAGNDITKILIVDDDAENIDILSNVLSEYKCIAAKSGEQALKIIESNNIPNLILLDISMPVMDGYKIIKRLKENNITKDIPVIFLTAKSETADEAKGIHLGAVDYITKPFSSAVVAARVKNHLQLKSIQETLKQQNEELKEAVKLREEVERISRHDLKSPLSAILGSAELLLEDNHLTNDQFKILKIIEKAGFRMLELINRSLDLLKMEQGTYKCKFENVDVVQVLKKVIEENNHIASPCDMKIFILKNGAMIMDENKFYVPGERYLFYCIFENLIKNAIENSPNGKNIKIDLFEDKDFVIKTHNKGVVAEDIRERFFDKYVTKNKKGGTGLGTYSAKLMVENMNGKINMETEENNGTTVTMQFPK